MPAEPAGLLGLVLAGGQSLRMGGPDKASLLLGGERLIERACRRLVPQVDRLMIAGPHPHGLDYGHVPDPPDGVSGPAAALHAALAWLESGPPCPPAAILTVPVDAPFFPDDLARRLAGTGAAAAATASGLHATFAFWPTEALERIAPLLRRPGGIALHRLLTEASARKVWFDDETAFTNINTPQDLAEAEALIGAGSPTPPARR